MKWISPKSSFFLILLVSFASICGLIWIAWTLFENGPVNTNLGGRIEHWLKIISALLSTVLISGNAYLSWLEHKDLLRTRRDERAGDKKIE